MGKTRRIISMLLIVVMLTAMASVGLSCTKQDGNDKLTTAISALDAEMVSLKSKNDYSTEKLTALQSAYDTALAAIKDAKDDAARDTALADGKTALAAIESVGAKTYTIRETIDSSPKCWNNHTWETNGDSYVFDHTEIGFVDRTMKTEGEYQETFEMATDIQDITAQATDAEKAKYGIKPDKDGNYEGRMYKITLNKDAKWQDGTPINADSYLYSMKALLDCKMKNTRADLYWSGENAIFNGEQYFKQDQIGAKVYKPIGEHEKEYESAGAALADGLELYVDINGFWGLTAADGSTVLSIKDETPIRDPAVEEGQDEDYVSAKYLYDNYLADGQQYAEYAGEYLDFVQSEIVKTSFEDVGLYKTNDYELIYVTAKIQPRFQFITSMTTTWLVYEKLYEGGKTTKGDLTVTDYGTSLDTYMAYGPYKLATFEKDKQIVFVKNENWYGYTDGKHEGQFITTGIKTDVISDHATLLQMFTKGEIDSVDLEADDMTEYGGSPYLLKTPNPSSFSPRFFFNTNLDVLKKLEAERNDGNNIQILSIQDFRKAMSWAFDRETWCKEVTAGDLPQVGLLGSLYFYDVENNPKSVYRNSDQAMQGIVNYYGLKYGEGERYETLKEAYQACTGYDLAKAKDLFTKAYNTAKEQGIYKDGQNIVINIGAAKGPATDALNKMEKKFNEFLAAGTAGTPLEGKVSVKYLFNINERYKDVNTGARECGYGALGGATYYPYRALSSYIFDDNRNGLGYITEGNFNAKTVNVTVKANFSGNGEEEITDTLWNWQETLYGPGATPGKYENAPHEVKLAILSAIEVALLNEAHMFPVTAMATVQLESKKVEYATKNYNVMYGFGGLRLMKHNYSDFEWDTYVKEQGGTLNYK